MKNRKKMVVIVMFAILASIGVLCILIYCSKTIAIELSLKDLQQDGEFQYAQAEWGGTLEEIRQTLPTVIEMDTARMPASEHIDFYKAKRLFSLDGQKAVVTMEFANERLQVMQFNFSIPKDNEEWLERQTEQLRELFGKESEQFDNSSERFRSRGYKWETENTTLQVVLIDGTETNVIFSLGIK